MPIWRSRVLVSRRIGNLRIVMISCGFKALFAQRCSGSNGPWQQKSGGRGVMMEGTEDRLRGEGAALGGQESSPGWIPWRP